MANKSSKKRIVKKAAPVIPEAQPPNAVFELVGENVYQCVDPVTGGIWQYVGRRPMTQEEIFLAVVRALTFYQMARPAKGTTSTIFQPML